MFKKFEEPELRALKAHSYKGCEYTPLDNLMNHFWFSLVRFLPEWLAPNLITFIGFLLMLSSTCLFYLSGPEFSYERPRWVLFYGVLTQFLYQTLDAVDGKQARKIGLSTPLGCLFDHGCDVIVSSFLLYQALVFLGFSENWWMLMFVTIFTFTGFQSVNIAERFTGVLKTNQGGVGVTELQFMGMALGLVSAIFGQAFFQFGILGIKLNFVIGLGFGFFALLQIYVLMAEVWKQGFIAEDVIRCFVPVLSIGVGSMLLFYNCGYSLPILFFIVSCAFEISTQKLIICNITEQSWPLVHFESIYILVLGFLVNSLRLSDFLQHLFLWANFLILLGYQGTYLYRLVIELSRTLDIYVFHVGRPSEKKNK